MSSVILTLIYFMQADHLSKMKKQKSELFIIENQFITFLSK